MTTDTPQLSDAKRALLEKRLRRDLPPARTRPRRITPRPPGCRVPLSFEQEQLWLVAQLAPDSPAYNECITVGLPGPLDVAALEHSFNEFVRRHEAWRTTFPVVDGQPAQVIQPAPTFRLPVVDLRGLPEAERMAQALALAREEAVRPFDLAHGPLLWPTLVRLGEADYKLYLTLHHIIFDGVSIYGVFLPELAALYRAFCAGQPSPLPELPIQYADYAVWQRQWLQGDVLEGHLAYWTRQLSGAPPLLELPTDRPRPAARTYHGALHAIILSRDLGEALKALSRREGVTLFMTLVAAFKTLLYRYCGQDDILLGIASAGAGRKRAETEGLIGYFLNTLVLRTNLGGNPTFRELLAQVRDVTLEAYAHEDVPFQQLVEHLRPERELSQNPLFQVMLTPEPPLAPLEPGWTLSQIDFHTDTAKFDLYLEFDERAEGIICRCEYSTDLFDAATIARMLEHWQVLLQSVASDPGQRLWEVPLLTEAERRQLLVEWNDTQADYPRNLCIHQLFEAQVERTPDAVAVVFEGEQLTYRELNQRANHLAHHLQTLGVGPEVLIGLCMEASWQLVVGLLGILKAGGAYVPLDPAYPRERLAFMLEDAQVTVLLTQEWLRERLPRQVASLVCLDSDWEVIAQQPVDDVRSAVTPENLAYALYTSGSTGQPKGVLGLHRGAVNRFHWMWEVYPFEPGEICCHKTSLSFVDSVWEIFGPLLRGIPSVIVPDHVRNDPQRLIQTLAEMGVTRIVLVPSLLRTLLDAEPDLQARLPALRLWVCSGEALPLELVQRFREQMPWGRLVNLYGSSEVAADVTWYDTTDRELRGCVPIGRPLANTQIYLLDQQQQPVPVGIPGELYVGGDGLARGYLNRPELTAERFIPHPFSSEPGARLYKTGDLARYLPDGNIEFLGRIDNQVKVRGFRIELGEIETVLVQNPAVQEAAVLAREDVPGDKRLVAYFVPSPDAPLASADELRQYLQQRLPAYMVPAAFVPLEALPLTPNGKVDRKALPMPDGSSAAQGTFVAPRTPVEDLLATIWADVLKVERVGVHDNFFELGGHSLLALGVVQRIEQVWGKKLALATLFAGPTIAQLAQALLEARDDESGVRTPVVPLQTGGSRRPFFFLHGHFLGTASYCFRLARDLGPDQPFYALDPYKLDDLPVPPSIETIAATHLEAVRAIQPDGPYLLGGFCNGGLVAYEMARQLHAQGQVVDLLVLMDPAPLPHAHPIWYRVLRGVIKYGGSLVGLGPEQQVAWFVRLRHMGRHLYNHVHDLRGRAVKNVECVGSADQSERGRWRDEASRAHPGLAALILTGEALYHDYLGLLHWAVLAYRPSSVYPGKITFFWPAQRPWHAGWWRPVAEATTVEEHVIPGRETTWKTDHLSALSECLRMCLDKAHAPVKEPIARGRASD